MLSRAHVAYESAGRRIVACGQHWLLDTRFFTRTVGRRTEYQYGEDEQYLLVLDANGALARVCLSR